MGERDWLTEEFEAHRARLRAVACRMLGSLAEADDAVQEAWLRPTTCAATGGIITGAIKWGDANFAFGQLRRLRAHTPWPPP
jgi:RNA polymerase sigma-70 factor, ECF subfamily